MPEDVGGSRFPDGDDHGGANEEFASVVFDEDFVRSARIHEPTAQERMLAASRAWTEEPFRPRLGVQDDDAVDDDEDAGLYGYAAEDEYGQEWDEDDGYAAGAYERPLRHRSAHARWHRTVAWVLAVVMGVGVVALTIAAVYRGASSGRQQPAPPPPPGTTRLDAPESLVPSVAVRTP